MDTQAHRLAGSLTAIERNDTMVKIVEIDLIEELLRKQKFQRKYLF